MNEPDEPVNPVRKDRSIDDVIPNDLCVDYVHVYISIWFIFYKRFPENVAIFLHREAEHAQI